MNATRLHCMWSILVQAIAWCHISHYLEPSHRASPGHNKFRGGFPILMLPRGQLWKAHSRTNIPIQTKYFHADSHINIPKQTISIQVPIQSINIESFNTPTPQLESTNSSSWSCLSHAPYKQILTSTSVSSHNHYILCEKQFVIGNHFEIHHYCQTSNIRRALVRQ